MNGLGGLNKSSGGVVLGLVQLQNPVVATRDDLAAQCRRICELTAKARRGMPSMDLVVFPEYSLHGLSMDTNPEIMCRIDGPEVEAFRETCRANRIWGCFSIMDLNPRGNQKRRHRERDKANADQPHGLILADHAGRGAFFQQS